MEKAKGNLKINFCSNINDDTIVHSNQIAREIALAKGGSFDLPMNSINPIPGDGDFVDIPFRHLSATIVGAGTWKATDFSNEKALKASMKMLEGKPVYLNHDLYVGNEIGVVGPTKWTKEYVNKNGVTIPAGIDAPMRIDSVLYPQYVRKMSGNNPSITSSSVTVVFDWESSHDFERANDFYYHIGEMIEGSMVRRIVTKITAFYESSLVWLGADPFAGLLDEDGEVKYIDTDGVVSLSASKPIQELYEKQNKFIIDFCLGQNKSLSLGNTNKNKTLKDMSVLKKLAVSLGVEETELTPEMLDSFEVVKKEDFDALKLKAEKEDFSVKFSDLNTQFEGVKTELVTLKADKVNVDAEVVTLKSEKEALESKVTELTHESAVVEMCKGIVEKRKQFAVEMYTKSVDGKTNETILAELNGETSFEKIEAKIELFGGKALNTFGASCKDCGSKEVSFRSSKEDDTDTKKIVDDKKLTFAERVILGN